jgi:Tfp pilus assembly protein PilF
MKTIVHPNDMWIIHREEIETIKDGNCDVYVLLDAVTKHCVGMLTSRELPSSLEVIELIRGATRKYVATPKSIAILKSDPLAEVVVAISKGLNVTPEVLTSKEISPLVEEFVKSFRGLKTGKDPSTMEKESISKDEIQAFTPQTYGPCPCASGEKYKFCCQKIFKHIANAMVEAECGSLNKALASMKEAEDKVGPTAEVLCRYGICWSFFDRSKSDEYFKRSQATNPNHPRTNYILGIEAREKRNFEEAIRYYQKAISNYPTEDKYHLNETYNNLGTAFYELGNYKDSKDAWEKALVLLPSDRVVIGNLIECIYENPDVPEELRKMSPFIQKFIERSGVKV